MSTTTDTVLDRVQRVKHSIAGVDDPRRVQVTVDGPCPTDGCDGRVIETIHPDSSTIHCDRCDTTFDV